MILQKEASRILFITLLLVIGSNIQARYDFSLSRGTAKKLRSAAVPFLSLVGHGICWVGVKTLWGVLVTDRYTKTANVPNFRYYLQVSKETNKVGYCFWNTAYNADLCVRFLLDFFFATKIVSSSRRLLKAVTQ